LIIEGKIERLESEKKQIFNFTYMHDETKWKAWEKENRDLFPAVLRHCGLIVVVHKKTSDKSYIPSFACETPDDDIMLPIQYKEVTFSVFRDPANTEEWRVQLQNALQAAQTE